MATINEEVEQAHGRLVALKEIQRAFPDARMNVAWDGGPHVPTVTGADALSLITGVRFVVSEGDVCALPLIELPDGARVYVDAFRHRVFASLLIKRLAETYPGAYAEFLAAVREEAR